MFKGSLAIRNANIITMAPHQMRAEAVAVSGGRIVAVGSWEDVKLRVKDFPVIDLPEKTVLPGFIDSHVHFTWTGLKEAALDFESAKTTDEIKAIIRQAAVGTPRGNVIYGMGLNHYHFAKDQLPASTDLDAAAPDHPVFILGVTGHYSLANRLCLDELNIASDTPGFGSIGWLRDRANSIALKRIQKRFVQQHGVEWLHRTAARRAVAVGLTTVHALEGGEQPDDSVTQELIAILPELPLRLIIWYETLEVATVQRSGLPRIGGCILLDGDFGPHTAAMMDPYADQPDSRGTLYHTQDEINGFVEEAHRAGLQIAMHAVGDRAVKQALDAYERALARWPRNDHRHRIEHFEIYDEALAKWALQLGVHLGIQPPFNTYFGGHTRLSSILGEERALRSDPVRSLIETGIQVGGGSDSCVTPLQPLYGVFAAVNHSNPNERIDVERALKLYTLDNAFLAFEEKEKGSVEVGKVGDLVVLAEDPTTVDPKTIADIPVAMTIVGGEIAYSAKQA